MTEILKTYFFIIDFTIGTSILITVIFLYHTGRISRYIWFLFWIGVLLGFTWEFGCNINMIVSSEPP